MRRQNRILSRLLLTHQAVLTVPGKASGRGGTPDEQDGAPKSRGKYFSAASSHPGLSTRLQMFAFMQGLTRVLCLLTNPKV